MPAPVALVPAVLDYGFPVRAAQEPVADPDTTGFGCFCIVSLQKNSCKFLVERQILRYPRLKMKFLPTQAIATDIDRFSTLSSTRFSPHSEVN
ncbi:hypothetical protein V6N13_121580 [Hibiscus sabdariffa]|uniref:Uncharacterized protein n=2 Tax=Hibiscus sabdariffa TaxID=183260 RepID=A0ABR2AIP8_9ROSI